MVQAVEGMSVRTGNPKRMIPPVASTGPEGATNTDASAIPAVGAVVHVVDFDTTTMSWEVEAYEYPGFSDIGIATGSMAATSGAGTIWFDGVREVLCLNYATLSVGDRIAPSATAWYAFKWAAGPMVVTGSVPSQDQPTGIAADSGTVWAQITNERCGCQYIACDAAEPHGPAATLVIKGGEVHFDDGGKGKAQLSRLEVYGGDNVIVQLGAPIALIVEDSLGAYNGMVASQLRFDDSVTVAGDGSGFTGINF